MSYRSIFTALTRVEEPPAALNFAHDFAEAQDAHLQVFCLGIDRAPTTYYEIGANAVVMHAAIEEAHARAAEIKQGVETSLSHSNQRWDTVSGISATAGVWRTIGLEARLADIAIVGLPYGTACGAEDSVVLEGLLFEAGCPTIVVPDGASSIRPESIVIGWNESREAIRAVRAALPLLKAAEAVHIAIIDPPTTGPERSDPGGALALYLARHDVRCDIHVMARQGDTVSQRLGRHIVETGSQMLVMGGYGHSRFREAVLGGATRDMLEHSKVPVLMAH